MSYYAILDNIAETVWARNPDPAHYSYTGVVLLVWDTDVQATADSNCAALNTALGASRFHVVPSPKTH